MKQLLLWSISILLLLLCVGNALTSNFNFGNLLVWLLTAACWAYTLFGRRIDAFLGTPFGRVIRILLMVGCGCVLLVLGVILSGQWGGRRQAEQAKAIVVLGCAVHGERPSLVLQQRLQTAYEYHLQHPELPIVVCGGQGPGEDIPEAEAMRRWLVERGVPERQVFCEDRSTSTEENFAFALSILQQLGIAPNQPVLFVTNGFHCYRAGRYAADQGLSAAAALPAPIAVTQILPCYLREVFAVVYYWTFKSPHTGFLRNLVGVMKLVTSHPEFFK